MTEIERPIDAGLGAGAAITVEHGAYTLILLAGLLARLLVLGQAPFSPAEAAASWPAWLDAWGWPVAHGQQPASALLHALQVFTFWLTGGGADWLARLPVALISAALPLLPWFWRHRIGRVAALALALLLALDPWMLALGRTAASSALSATLALVAMTAFETQAQRGGRAAAYVAAVASGLLLVSGPQAWSWAVLLVLQWVLARPAVTRAEAAARAEAAGGEAARPSSWRGPLLAGGAAAVLGATGWLAQPQELAMVSASLSNWLAQVSSGPYGLGYPWLRLVIDRPFTLLFGLVGLVSLRPFARRGAGGLFLVAWLLWGAILILLPGRTPEALPVLGSALAVCAALGVQWLYTQARAEDDWREAGLLALLLAGVLLSLHFWTAGLVFATTMPVVKGLLAAAMLVLVALLLIGFGLMAGGRQAMIVGLGVAGSFLLAAQLSATWQLVYTQRQPAHLSGFFASEGLADARRLAEDVSSLSSLRTGDSGELAVQVVTGPSLQPDPQVGWLLRKMRNLTFVASPGAGAQVAPGREPLVVAAPGAVSSEWELPYVGAGYRLRQGWLPSALAATADSEEISAWNSRWRPWLRWLIYREAPPPEPGTVDLWALP